MKLFQAATCLFFILTCHAAGQAAQVSVQRVPDGGLQPQGAVDDRGAFHLVYLKGDPSACDIFYRRSADEGKTWSAPLRVNSRPGSAIAMGTVRGAQLAVGSAGRVHVAWMGSRATTPTAPDGSSAMLYARMNDAGTAFDDQRNVIAEHAGLDGGGSIAADAAGHVYVAWHAPSAPGTGEAGRAVWMVGSTDEGKTFGKEAQLSKGETGACGCCGMKLFATKTGIFALYRAATEKVHRDIYFVKQSIDGPATSLKVAEVTLNACPMSTASLAATSAGVVAAWETDKQIQWMMSADKEKKPPVVHTLPGMAKSSRRFPVIGANAKGEVLVAWTEGTAWQKGGEVVWQVFDSSGKSIVGPKREEKLAAWSLPVLFGKSNGDFVVMY